MKRAVVLLVVAAAVMAAAAGAVLAEDKTCTGGDCVGTREADTLTGSANTDRIAGMEGNDTIDGGAQFDFIYGDEGNDTITDTSTGDNDRIWGDEGNDTINVQEGDNFPDTVDCGPGKKDKVFFDKGFDFIAKNCERKNP